MLLNPIVTKLLTDYDEDIKLSEQYEFCRKVQDQYRMFIEQSTTCIKPLDKKIQQKFFFGEYSKWLKWVNKNIILKLGIDKIESTRVKLRIATSMLEKLDLEKDILICVLDNLVRNVNSESYILSTEDLPF